jgi:hypothetical protein
VPLPAFLKKVKKSPLLRPLRKVVGAVREFNFHYTNEALGFLSWVVQSIKSFRPHGGAQRRLLLVYDLSTQPFSIGDILICQLASLVIREQNNLGLIDFALVYDPQRPASSDPSFAHITPENVLFHVASILPVAQVNPHHGSLFVFNSHRQLKQFIGAHASEYFVWPSAWRFWKQTYNYYEVLNNLIHNYYRQHGTIPHLSCRPFLVDWAKTFYAEHVQPAVPVTVQLRKNKNICTSRNVEIDPWLDFFRYCERRYAVRFVIVGALSEMDARLRECRNVLIAKDHGTTVEQDLALIQTAAMHMGASSGPSCMALFSDKPYLIVNTNAHLGGHDDFVATDGAWHFTYSTPYQRCCEPPTTVELLIAEFARVWQGVELTEWKKPGAVPSRQELYSWLR